MKNKFIEEFNKNKVSKEFLDSCKKANNLFGGKSMGNLDNIIYNLRKEFNQYYNEGYKQGYKEGSSEITKEIFDINWTSEERQIITKFAVWCYLNGIHFDFMTKSGECANDRIMNIINRYYEGEK